MKVKIRQDLIIGQILGNAGGVDWPDHLKNIDRQLLRYDGEDIVLLSDHSNYYIDDFGIKHIVQHDKRWQNLKCNFDDDLFFDDVPGRWRVKTPRDQQRENELGTNKQIDKEAEEIYITAVPELLDYITGQMDCPQTLKDKITAYKNKLNEKI